jgi:hypothetical protein
VKDKTGKDLKYKEWAEKIKSSFENQFWIP